MKLLETILFFLFAIAVTGCQKDCPDTKETDFDLSSQFLEQTIWEGTFVMYDTTDGEPLQGLVNIFFQTESSVTFTVTYNNKEVNPSKETVKYTAKKDMLSLVGSPSLLSGGDWLLIEGNKDRLILGKDLQDGNWTQKMTLGRKY